MLRSTIVAVAVACAACAACAGGRPAPAPVTTSARATPSHDASAIAPVSIDASAIDADAHVVDAGAADALVEAASPLATIFDGDPASGPIKLGETRCGPGCLQYPAGWLAADDGGFVYTWFFRGEGRFGTAEVMRCPLPKLDVASLAFRLKYAGGDKVAWSTPVDASIGRDHLHALVAEGTGTSHGRKAHFWYAYVDLPSRKDLVIAYVVDGEPARRIDETIAVVRSVHATDGRAPAR